MDEWLRIEGGWGRDQWVFAGRRNDVSRRMFAHSKVSDRIWTDGIGLIYIHKSLIKGVINGKR